VYSTCIFCHSALGANEVIEHFPIGHRLAFDASKGRLWVVCGQCERWNLTPLEERWEAIEECERGFRATALRVSTGSIGLARMRDGTELVRIGRPLRPELAEWRYGDQFGRRRRRMMLRSGLGVLTVGGIFLGGAALGFGVSVAVTWTAAYLTNRMMPRGTPGDVVAVVTDASEQSVRITRSALERARLAWENDNWALELPWIDGDLTTLVGWEAIGAAALLMPAANRFGGSSRMTRDALALLEQHRHADALFRAVAAEWDGTATGYRDLPNDRIEFVAKGPRGYLTRLAPAQRLALEMAAHEDAERLALEGELRALEAAWRNAEEIAAIADNLLPS